MNTIADFRNKYDEDLEPFELKRIDLHNKVLICIFSSTESTVLHKRSCTLVAPGIQTSTFSVL